MVIVEKRQLAIALRRAILQYREALRLMIPSPNANRLLGKAEGLQEALTIVEGEEYAFAVWDDAWRDDLATV